MPQKQYPSFYEKAIPIALAVIGVLIIVLLAIVVYVLASS